ncbi:adenosine kinase [Sphingomonas sp. SUN039]|uniref:adenosine kinase n=1 Tax=Sphingomonas sp. SUN039 TaxID=2937787 RepID=UPI0021641D39|nr:adenosine kinase [Sphingomonas sp. SUN039]UVO55003.1 adenosine kinase [Sphingomonas sp. SUN039]
MTTDARYDVVAIGNAIVDVIASASLDFLASEGLESGSMRLIDGDAAVALYDRMGPAREISGGSAANSLAGLAVLGHACAFIGQVADDQLGEVFTHDMRATGIAFDVPAQPGPPPTARCLILIAPDGERTMNTALAMAHRLPASAIDEDMIGRAKYLLIEGYLWDAPEPQAAIKRAMAAAKRGRCKVFFALSALYLMGIYRDDFLSLIDDGIIDTLFCNDEEVAALMQTDDLESAIAALSVKVPTLVVTRGANGALAVQGGERAEIAAETVARVVDTTGAGDTFTSGFLAGQLEGRSLADSLTMGAICAAECIGHYGPRPEADLRALVDARLG